MFLNIFLTFGPMYGAAEFWTNSRYIIRSTDNYTIFDTRIIVISQLVSAPSVHTLLVRQPHQSKVQSALKATILHEIMWHFHNRVSRLTFRLMVQNETKDTSQFSWENIKAKKNVQGFWLLGGLSTIFRESKIEKIKKI